LTGDGRKDTGHTSVLLSQQPAVAGVQQGRLQAGGVWKIKDLYARYLAAVSGKDSSGYVVWFRMVRVDCPGKVNGVN